MIKIGDRVYLDGYHYEVVCMDRTNHGLALIDDKGAMVPRKPVYMVPKSVELEYIATKTFELGDKVTSLLKDRAGQAMTGTVVGYELGNRIVVKSDRGNDRVRYSYKPSEITKYVAPKPIIIPIAKLIELHNGQLKFDVDNNDYEVLIKVLRRR